MQTGRTETNSAAHSGGTRRWFRLVRMWSQLSYGIIPMSRRALGDGGPDRTRTCDLRFRKPLLYPAELRDHRFIFNNLATSSRSSILPLFSQRRISGAKMQGAPGRQRVDRVSRSAKRIIIGFPVRLCLRLPRFSVSLRFGRSLRPPYLRFLHWGGDAWIRAARLHASLRVLVFFFQGSPFA
jgi:hypothetical protein